MAACHPSVINSTLTLNFRILNRSTLASFNDTVHIHEGCGMLLWHSYIFLIYFKKSQSGNRAPMIFPLELYTYRNPKKGFLFKTFVYSSFSICIKFRINGIMWIALQTRKSLPGFEIETCAGSECCCSVLDYVSILNRIRWLRKTALSPCFPKPEILNQANSNMKSKAQNLPQLKTLSEPFFF